MIDYRYYLTSLAAVFLALAAGVTLGAGPLQTTISDALSGEVSSVRAQNAKLSSTLQEAQKNRSDTENYLAQLGAQINNQALIEHSVGLVVFPGVAADNIAKTEKSLQDAGANVAKMQLTERFVSPKFSEYRNSLAPQLTNYLSTPPASSASAEEILSSALMDVYTGSKDQATLRSILTNSENPMVVLPEGNFKANSFVVILPPQKPRMTPEADDDGSEGEVTPNYSNLVSGFASAPKSAVVLGNALSADSPLSIVRSQNTAITTIDSFPSQQALVSLPQALKTADAQARPFGIQQGASLIVPSFTVNTKTN